MQELIKYILQGGGKLRGDGKLEYGGNLTLQFTNAALGSWIITLVLKPVRFQNESEMSTCLKPLWFQNESDESTFSCYKAPKKWSDGTACV